MPKGKGYICLCLSKYVGRRRGEGVSGFLGQPWLRGEGAPQAEGRHSDRAVLQSLGSLPKSLLPCILTARDTAQSDNVLSPTSTSPGLPCSYEWSDDRVPGETEWNSAECFCKSFALWI